jgi:formimidoylglutamate deiminase
VPRAFFAPTAMLPDGWAHDLRIEIDAAGRITSLEPDGNATGAERLAGPVLPAMPNLHCHTFQRAMAGLAERSGPDGEDFWAWRTVMYRFIERLTPEDLEAISAQAYVEMLKSGYGAVAEFHYLHNDPAGAAYENPAELAERIVAAASQSGIRLTLLPVLYQTGDFGGAPPSEGQCRFLKTLDSFFDLMARLAPLADKPGKGRGFRLGMAPHSLRAVTPDALKEALATLDRLDATAPIHIHAAEQEKEVRDCLAWSGARPVQWLLDNIRLDARWSVIHATHMKPGEIDGLAASGAVAGICPSTEGNLGDGFFRFAEYLEPGGRFGIGSDANVGLDPAEELRWLHYGQRLLRGKRKLDKRKVAASLGPPLWRAAAQGGAQSLGQPIGALAVGRFADLLVLDADHPALAGRSDDLSVDSFIFGPARGALRDVMVGGEWLVREGHHRDEEAIAARYRRTVEALVRE